MTGNKTPIDQRKGNNSSKESTPRGRGFVWSSWKGAKNQPSGPGVVGAMEYWSNGLELREGF